MKAKQSSVGRELESFLLWVIPVCDRLPKNSAALQRLGHKLIDAVCETQTFIRLALKTSDYALRLELIESMVIRIEEIKSIMDALAEFSTKNGTVRIISLRQKACYLTQMESISRQVSGWERKTRKALEDQDFEEGRGEQSRQKHD